MIHDCESLFLFIPFIGSLSKYYDIITIADSTHDFLMIEPFMDLFVRVHFYYCNFPELRGESVHALFSIGFYIDLSSGAIMNGHAILSSVERRKVAHKLNIIIICKCMTREKYNISQCISNYIIQYFHEVGTWQRVG